MTGVVMMARWQLLAVLSALFARATAMMAKVEVRDVDSDLATAIRKTVILVSSWGIAGARGVVSFASVSTKA